MKQGWEMQREGSMPIELWENMQRGQRTAFDWLECACCSVPWNALTQLNGVDEILDTGDDCHEVNMKQRSQMFGMDVWNEGSCPVQIIDHHRWERSDLWTRFTRDTNIFRWSFMKQQVTFHLPARGPIDLKSPPGKIYSFSILHLAISFRPSLVSPVWSCFEFFTLTSNHVLPDGIWRISSPSSEQFRSSGHQTTFC